MTEYAPTTAELLDLDNGVAQRQDSFRFDLHSLDGEKLGELAPEAGRPPVVSCDVARRLGRTLTSFNLPASDVTFIDPLSMNVRPYMVLQNGAEFPLGLFRWASLTRGDQPWGVERASSLVDQSVILDQQLTGVFSRGVGVNLVLAARRLAEQVIAPSDIDMVPNVAAVSPWAGIAYSPGHNRLSAMDQLLEDCGHLPSYFDESGRLQLRPPPLPTSTPDVDYQTSGPTRVVTGSVERWSNIIDVPNLFVVWSSSGTGPSYRAVLRTPASAPHSIENRGYPVPDVHSSGQLGSMAQARLIAYYRSIRYQAAYDFMAFQSTPDPRHRTWSLIRWVDGSIWLELAWRLVCAPGAPGGVMDHTVRRIYAPTDEEDI